MTSIRKECFFIHLVMIIQLGSTCSQSSSWEVKEISLAPEWYSRKVGENHVQKNTYKQNEREVHEYILPENKKLIYLYQHNEAQLIYFDVDSTLLFTNSYGFSSRTWTPDFDTFAFLSIEIANEDFEAGDLYIFNLITRDKTQIKSRIGYTNPKFSPDGRKLAFADTGDLYIYDLRQRALHKVFHKGGLDIEEPTTWYIACSYMEWSDNSTKLVFRYYINTMKENYQLYEVTLL